jgi:hypothetical protein
MAASVLETTATRKPSKAYYAILDTTHGVLTKVDGTIYFMATDSGDITEIEPEHCPFLMPLGECGLADTQQLMDRLHGGYAAVACSRLQEVA